MSEYLSYLFPVLVEERYQTLSGGVERIGRHERSHVIIYSVQFPSLKIDDER